MAWSIGGKGYVFGGRNAKGEICHDLWEYDPGADAWHPLGEQPLPARVNGAAIAVGEKVYAGLGFNGHAYQSQAYLQDWWVYSPADSTWSRLADFPNSNTVGAIPFAEGGKIYCVHGFGTGFSADVVCYDIASDTWTVIERPNRKEEAAMAGAGASIGGRHFYGTGYNTTNLNYWYELPLDGEWTKRADVPGSRETAVCTATEQYIYLSGGRHFGGLLNKGTVYDDILRYDIRQDKWTLAGHLGHKAENQIAFSIGGAAYIGLGENDEEGVLNNLYKIED